MSDTEDELYDGRWRFGTARQHRSGAVQVIEVVTYPRTVGARDRLAMLEYTHQTWGPHGFRAWVAYQRARWRLKLALWRERRAAKDSDLPDS